MVRVVKLGGLLGSLFKDDVAFYLAYSGRMPREALI